MITCIRMHGQCGENGPLHTIMTAVITEEVSGCGVCVSSLLVSGFDVDIVDCRVDVSFITQKLNRLPV